MTERDERLGVLDHLAGGRDQAEPGEHRVRPARELSQHRPGVALVPRLRIDPLPEMHRRVDAEGRASRRVDGARLPKRVLPHERDGVGVVRVVLDVPRRDGLERNRELLEDGASLRRGGCEDEPLRHEGFAATQISSAGQLRDQSAENTV